MAGGEADPDPLKEVWKIMGFANAIPGHGVQYQGGLVWSVKVRPDGAQMSQPNQGALKKELQAKLADTLIQTGQIIKGVNAGFDDEPAEIPPPPLPPAKSATEALADPPSRSGGVG